MAISNANPVTATLLRYRYLATAGQTSISGVDLNGINLAYTPGFEQVYLNGVLLVRGQDYIATTGSSITGLTPGLQLNDSIEILTFSPFTIANNIVLATGGANDQVLIYDSTQPSSTRWGDDYQTLMIMGVR